MGYYSDLCVQLMDLGIESPQEKSPPPCEECGSPRAIRGLVVEEGHWLLKLHCINEGCEGFRKASYESIYTLR